MNEHTMRTINEALNALSCEPWQEDWGWVCVLTDAVNELEKRRQRQEAIPVPPHISVRPGVMSGEPCIYGHRLTTLQFAELWWSGEWTMESILDNWSITRTEVLLCLQFEAVHGSRQWKKRWGKWAVQWADQFWHEDYSGIEMAPQKDCPEIKDVV